MKNKILIIFLSLVTMGVSAQVAPDSVLRSKKGIPILPQKGDWAIGADALPYLNYIGNIFNNTTNNTLDLGSQTLYGRYFIANNTAIRVLVGINKGSSLEKHYVRDDAAFFLDQLSKTQTEDSYEHKFTSYNIDLGYQKFRGYGSLRGFYGVHVGFEVARDQYVYTYGNPITVDNAKPTSYWGFNGDNSRTLESDNGFTNSIMAGAIGGVEYYFAPKISIGGEITLSLNYSWKTQGNAKYEVLNGTQVQQFDVASSPKGRTYTSLSTYRPANFNGGLYLMFHF